jgi:hypothetical protein
MAEVKDPITYEGFACQDDDECPNPNKNFYAWGTPPLNEEDIAKAEEPEVEMGIGEYTGLGRAWSNMIPEVRSKISKTGDVANA